MLSLPSVMKILGIVPGIIAIVCIGCLTWYAAFVLLQFYRKHPYVVNMVDMCTVVGGKKFEIVAGIMNVIQFIFFSASPAVTLSVAFNTISDHATCTVVFIFVSCAISWIFSLPRTMKFVSMCGIPSAISVLIAVGIALISLAVAGPAKAPAGWNRKIEIVGNPTFREGLNAFLKIVYAYAANFTVVSYMTEMVNPSRDFSFSLTVLELSSIFFYTSVAIVLYCLAGEYTVSPVLGAAATVPAKIAYGIALFAILTTLYPTHTLVANTSTLWPCERWMPFTRSQTTAPSRGAPGALVLLFSRLSSSSFLMPSLYLIRSCLLPLRLPFPSLLTVLAPSFGSI